MALESLQDGIFSEKTDVVSYIGSSLYIVQTFTLWLSGPPHSPSSSSPPTSQCTHMHTQWSFGVTCWEIYSLGRTPYPGLDPSSLIKFLEAGNRLEKPTNAACTDEMWAVRRLSTYYNFIIDGPQVHNEFDCRFHSHLSKCILIATLLATACWRSVPSQKLLQFPNICHCTTAFCSRTSSSGALFPPYCSMCLANDACFNRLFFHLSLLLFSLTIVIVLQLLNCTSLLVSGCWQEATILWPGDRHSNHSGGHCWLHGL